MNYGQRITLILELPPLILVQWRREKKYSICGNLRRALNKLVPLPEEIVEGHTNHTKSQKYCLQNVKKCKTFVQCTRHTGISCQNFFHSTIILPWRVSWMSRGGSVQRSGQAQKSVNLQYNMLGPLDDETNESSTKRLMFQVLFFFHDFLQNSLQKSFQFIFLFLKKKYKNKSKEF